MSVEAGASGVASLFKFFEQSPLQLCVCPDSSLAGWLEQEDRNPRKTNKAITRNIKTPLKEKNELLKTRMIISHLQKR